MMEIFYIEGDRVRPTTHILLISPFKEIWERDKSPKKSQAIKEFTYIEFLCSPKKSNPFSGYSEDNRPHEIIRQAFKGEKFNTKEKLLVEAIEVYNKWINEAIPSVRYLNAAKSAAEKVLTFLNDLDLTRQTDKGTPLYKPNDIVSPIMNLEKVLSSLSGLQKRVEQDMLEKQRTRAESQINMFEDP